MKQKFSLGSKIVLGFLIMMFFVLSVEHHSKTSAEENPINISTTVDSVLFNVDNMKPGDWAERELTVQNHGSSDFNYRLEAKKTSGNDMLYEALVFELKVADEEIFKGRLDEFSGFTSRFLQSEHEEDMVMKMEFPYELGNEYQGLEVEVLITFFAETEVDQEEVPDDQDIAHQLPITGGTSGGLGDGSGVGSDDEVAAGHILPRTATNNFNFLLIGGLLVAFGFVLYTYHQRNNMIGEKF